MSEFLNNSDDYSSEYSSGIDFDHAVRLPGGGSTCDIFKTRWQRRDVFVKRLKEENRSKPIYLDALDKEYEIGVCLKHTSLPDYREIHRDYIVMDYIDGMTLAEMIRRDDSWLKSEKHIRSMLCQLVDVVDYLHNHHVIHCDIKPDNIMITANGHDLVLVDFDKCYTDALNDTSGNPEKYGVSIKEAGSIAIDFHGIAKVVELLKAEVPGFKFRKYKDFVRKCYRPDVTCDELTDLLSDNGLLYGKKIWLTGVVFFAVAILIGVLYTFIGNPEDKSGDITVISDESERDSIRNDIAKNKIESESPQISYSQDTPSQPPIKEKGKAVAGESDAVALLEERIRPYFNELVGKLNRLDKAKNDTTLSYSQLNDSIREYGRLEATHLATVMDVVHQLLPDIRESEMGELISNTPSYSNYIRRAKSVKREFRLEMDRRRK